MTARSSTAPAAAYIVFGRPDIQQAEIDEVLATLRSGWIGTGPRVKQFEQLTAAYLGARHAVATNSCTAALHLALLALGVGPGDEVIVPTLTFCATANVVLHTGARPVFVDVDAATQCVTVEAVAAAITPRTKALLPVHFAGWPAAMPELRALADAHGLNIVQDAAHCIEGRVDGLPPSRFGDVSCLSFYATKNVVTGEGGMAVTDDADLAQRMRVLGLHGIDADAWQRFSAAGYQHYQCVIPGFKYNMMDLQAALGIHQLARVEDNLRVRERQWGRYLRALRDLPLDLPRDPRPGLRHARHLFTVRVRPEATVTRDEFIQALHRRGVGSGVHYIPVHAHAYYRQRFGDADAAFPVASSIGATTCSLPLGPGLRDREQAYIIEAVREILDASRSAGV